MALTDAIMAFARPIVRLMLAISMFAIFAVAAPLRTAGLEAQRRAGRAPTPAPQLPTGTIAPFSLGTSPLAMSGPARAGKYVASAGRRSIIMGTEDGRFEVWSWPIKWMHDFSIAFRVPKYSTPVPGRDVAQSVSVRPEGVTIEYAHETFTVRQHVFAPLDLPAVVMLLEVDALRPLEIVATFRPDIHLAWPASLGGQYLVWNQDARAFLFSESRRRINAFLGSPGVTQASDVPAHQLSAAPPQLVIGVGGTGERYTPPVLGEPPGKGINLRVAYIPIILAGGEMPRDSARALYDRLLRPGEIEREWNRRVAHADSIRETLLSLRSPDPALHHALEWAKVNLDEAMVCNPDLGCGLVAGYGLSGGASDRPGFGWFFGGDAAINSLAMTSAGQWQLVRDGVFRFFARYQRADGKITHEISQGAAKIDWFGAYPYAFYHGDTTPFWILAFGEYWRQSADSTLLGELWPNLRKAYDWSRRTDTDGDGLMENPVAGAGALEVGDLQIGIVSDVYLSGVWVAALDRFARMARAMNEPALADSALAVRTLALRTIESALWMPRLGQYAFAILEGGRINENLTAWPATAMSFDLFDRERGAQMAARLASSSILTDWGARPLSSTSPLFDPLHYNNGAVWPFVTGWVSLAQYRYHNPHAGRLALEAIARTGFDEVLGRNPEVISGRLYKPLDTSVPHQFFATSMVVTPLVRGLLGLDVDAVARRVIVAPHLPPEWDTVRADGIAVGRDRISVLLRQETGRITADVIRAGPDRSPIELVFSPALPLAASLTGSGQLERTPGDVHAVVRGTLRDTLRLEVAFRGGWQTIPPRQAPRIGDRSVALRVLSEREDSGRYVLSLEGQAGRSYTLRVRGPARFSVADAAAAAAVDAAGYRAVTVSFPADGANSDGFTRRILTFTAPASAGAR